MIDIVDRLRFDESRCRLQFSKGVAGNIEAAADEIRRLRQRILDAELALNVWDKGHDSEYWLRHPTPMSRT